MKKLKKRSSENFVNYFHYLSLLNLNYFIDDLKNKISDDITNILNENYSRYSKYLIIFLNKVNNIK